MKLDFTYHASNHLSEREKDVSSEEIKKVIRYPDTVTLEGNKFIARKKIGDKIVRVVYSYNKAKNKYLIITFYKESR